MHSYVPFPFDAATWQAFGRFFQVPYRLLDNPQTYTCPETEANCSQPSDRALARLETLQVKDDPLLSQTPLIYAASGSWKAWPNCCFPCPVQAQDDIF